MKLQKPLLAALFFIALPLAAQVNDTYIIPAAANLPGGFNTRWMTQLSIFNPQIDNALKVSVTFLPTGGGAPMEVLIPVPPNSDRTTDNALSEIFGVSGSGALLVATFPEDNPKVPDDVISRSFLVTSNTFTKTSDGGTFGQTVPGVWTGLQDYKTDGISAVAHGIRQIVRFGWRTNYGATNLGNAPITLRISIYDRDGNTIVKDFTHEVPAQAHMQWLLPAEVDLGAIEFFVDDPSGQAVVFPYTSTLDRYTGDPTYQSPALLASAKTLFGKGPVVPTSIGKKIDINTARAIRANATRLGEVQLRHE